MVRGPFVRLERVSPVVLQKVRVVPRLARRLGLGRRAREHVRGHVRAPPAVQAPAVPARHASRRPRPIELSKPARSALDARRGDVWAWKSTRPRAARRRHSSRRVSTSARSPRPQPVRSRRHWMRHMLSVSPRRASFNLPRNRVVFFIRAQPATVRVPPSTTLPLLHRWHIVPRWSRAAPATIAPH